MYIIPVIFLDVYAEFDEVYVHLGDIELEGFVENLHSSVVVDR